MIDYDNQIVIDECSKGWDDEFVAVDIETTGLDPLLDKITEIAATAWNTA